jgi:hypothetical protein
VPASIAEALGLFEIDADELAYAAFDHVHEKLPGVQGTHYGNWLGLTRGACKNPALPPLPCFPEGLEAHAIGWKGELYAELVFQLAVRHPFVLGIKTPRQRA